MRDKRLFVATAKEWRAWLKKHGTTEPDIWLVYHHKDSGLPTMEYAESVEEALCYGWIDTTIKNIDETSYMRRFTPRRRDSKWSAVNKARLKKLIAAGKMTEAGLEAAKDAELPERAAQRMADRVVELPDEFVRELKRHPKAFQALETLAPSYRRFYVGWITAAKREETRWRRLAEAIRLLEAGVTKLIK